MQYCRKCANALNYATSFISHRRRCERCRRDKECYDVIAHQTETPITPTIRESVFRRTGHRQARYRCCHCDEEINHLKYHSTIFESGKYYIENEDLVSEDSETDSTTYYCPECDHELYDPNDSEEIILIEEGEEEENSLV